MSIKPYGKDRIQNAKNDLEIAYSSENDDLRKLYALFSIANSLIVIAENGRKKK